jgi:hypothetical protein
MIQSKGDGGELALDVLRNNTPLHFDIRLNARPLAEYARDGAPPELLDAYNLHVRGYAVWRARHFSLPSRVRERTPSSAVIELPE